MSGKIARWSDLPWVGSAMNGSDLDRLAVLIERDRDSLLSAWRRQVRQLPSAADLDTPTLNDHMPGILHELALALRSRSNASITETLMEGSPPAHGLQRAADGFDIAEIVAEYNILRDCIHDLASAAGIALQGQPFHILNRVLDNAIGIAVQTFAAHQAAQVQSRREEYLSFVMHDLRTPLSAVALAARLLERTAPTLLADDHNGIVFKSMQRNLAQLEKLVTKILDENVNVEAPAGVRAVKRHLDLWPLVEGVLDTLYPVSEQNRATLINLIPADLVVFADAGLLRRVIQNLVANAINYAPRGQITVGAKSGDTHSPTECWVADDGIGIKHELLDKVFDKGETTNENPASTGLGLAIVKSFVEAHGGTIAVESQENHGSTFRFTIPY